MREIERSFGDRRTADAVHVRSVGGNEKRGIDVLIDVGVLVANSDGTIDDMESEMLIGSLEEAAGTNGMNVDALRSRVGERVTAMDAD